MGRHGGGAFSGKDPTKVDRSACYMARYIAKNVVAAGLATRCEVQLAYAIGVAEPVSVWWTRTAPGRSRTSEIESCVRKHFDADAARHHRDARSAPADLPQTAAYGHFGRLFST
jgi:S-adenosylmethionine synthetase